MSDKKITIEIDESKFDGAADYYERVSPTLPKESCEEKIVEVVAEVAQRAAAQALMQIYNTLEARHELKEKFETETDGEIKNLFATIAPFSLRIKE